MMEKHKILEIISQMADILEILIYHNASNYSDVLDRYLRTLRSLIENCAEKTEEAK